MLAELRERVAPAPATPAAGGTEVPDGVASIIGRAPPAKFDSAGLTKVDPTARIDAEGAGPLLRGPAP